MITTEKLLKLLKKANGNCSDYRAAKILNVNNGTVSSWVCGRNRMSEESARKAAQLLGLDEDYVVACIHAEKLEGTEMYPVWERICERLEGDSRAA